MLLLLLLLLASGDAAASLAKLCSCFCLCFRICLFLSPIFSSLAPHQLQGLFPSVAVTVVVLLFSSFTNVQVFVLADASEVTIAAAAAIDLTQK